MSSLFFVRHAQASAYAADYDNLSEKGIHQSRLLGESLTARGFSFDSVVVGPLKRHRQTEQHVRTAATDKGLKLPGAQTVDAFGEISASRLSDEAMRRVLPSCPDLREQLAQDELDDDGRTAMRHYAGVFQKLMERWSIGELGEDMVSYADFRHQVIDGLQKLMRSEGRDKRIIVFTSGGPICVAVMLALGLPPSKFVEMLFSLNNASITELLYTEHKLSLKRFNDIGYLHADHMTGI